MNKNTFNQFSSKGPFSNIPEMVKTDSNNASMILKLPPLSTYFIKSLNFSGIIQGKSSSDAEAKKRSPWYKLIFAKSTAGSEKESDINIELLSDNSEFQRITTLNKPTNILINLFSNTTSIVTLNINFSNSYTILNPKENILSYSENITRVSSGKDVETIGGFGIVTLISENNLQKITLQKNQDMVFEADRLVGFVNNSKLKFEWTTLSSKTLYGNAKRYLKCIGEGQLLLKN